MIKKLSKEVWSKIQAGEVIEGPSGIIRELIDNSIDAKSENVSVLFVDSDLKKIIVEDDGEGIKYDDSFLLFNNHSTSKINEFEDLNKLESLGFRGEALFSIGSVSYVNLKSRNIDEEIGFELVINGGKKILHEKIPFSKGTRISVEKIFFNVPAREKFLENKNKELQSIKQVFLGKAFSTKNVALTLASEKKVIYEFKKANTTEERIKEIFPDLDISSMGIIDKTDFEKQKKYFLDKYKIKEIKIICSNRLIYSKNKSNYFFSFNKRSAINENLLKRLKIFYSNYLPKGFYPYFFLDIELEASFIDCNVHPAKRDIKLKDETEFINSIIDMINFKLSQNQIIYYNNGFISSTKDESTYGNNHNIDIQTRILFENKDNDKNLFFDEVKNSDDNYYENNLLENCTDKFNRSEISNYLLKGKFLGLLFNTYLLFENGNALLIVDQHAADERITYNLLIKNIKSKKRILMFPKIIDLNNYNDENVINLFENAGIEISILADFKAQIYAIPDIVPSYDEQNFIEETINFINDNRFIKYAEIDKFVSNFYQNIVAKSACHLAIRQNDILSENEAKKLCKTLFEQDDYQSCPHGRPTFFIIDKNSFEKTFLRKK